jgi:hypothetical protein
VVTAGRIVGQALAISTLSIVGGVGTAAGSPSQPGPAVGISRAPLSVPVRDLPTVSSGPAAPAPARPRRPAAIESLSAPLQNFDGEVNTCSCAPPDPTGDVGPSNYVQAVNLTFQVFNKTGTSLAGPSALLSLFSGAGAPCQATIFGRPLVQYDQLADRWVIAFESGPGSDSQDECVAVSQTNDPAGAYYRYDFHFSNQFIDLVKIGVWPDGYYFGFDVFDPMVGTYLGPQVAVTDRAKMLLGQAATFQSFGPFAPNPASGSTPLKAPVPADLEGSNLPAPGTPEFYFGLDPIGNSIGVGEFHVDWVTPASSTFTALPSLSTSPFTFLCPLTNACVPQAGTANKVDEGGNRLMYRAPYRVIGSHDAVVLDHTVQDPGLGVAEIRWEEIRGLALGSPSIFQQGDYNPSDGNWRWMGSIAMDRAGNMALGFSESSSQINPRIRYTGRLVGDPPGQMTQAEQVLIDGTGSETGLQRWGDYTTMTVDPVDGCTFWYTNEYYATTGSIWRTRVGAFKFTGQSECNPPTAVEVSRLSTRWASRGVAVTWRAPSPARIAGFDLFRNGVRLNRRLIPATGVGTYRYLDRTARRGAFATYRLRIVDLVGKASWYGVSVVPAP